MRRMITLILTGLMVIGTSATALAEEDKPAQLEANEFADAKALYIWNATVYQLFIEEAERQEAERIAQERAAYEQSLSTEVQESSATSYAVTIPAPSTSSGGSVWDALAQCESGGNWSINTGNGYYGGLQFSISSWNAVGGTGLPSDASREEQIARAEQLAASGGFGHWPSCSAQLGL